MAIALIVFSILSMLQATLLGNANAAEFDKRSPLATNVLSLFGLTDTVYPDLNLMKGSNITLWNKDTNIDSNQYPINGDWAATLLQARARLTSEQWTNIGSQVLPCYDYVLKWSGKGSIVVNIQKGTDWYNASNLVDAIVSAPNSNRLTFSIPANNMEYYGLSLNFAPDPTDHIRDVKLVCANREALFDSGKNFNPDWIKTYAPYKSVRFSPTYMNYSWDRTGKIGDLSYAQSVKPGTPYPSATDRNPPLEWVIDFANEAKVELWYQIHDELTESEVNTIAQTVKARLNPELEFHIEYSNEPWHRSEIFPQNTRIRNAMTSQFNIDGQQNALLNFCTAATYEKLVQPNGSWSCNLRQDMAPDINKFDLAVKVISKRTKTNYIVSPSGIANTTQAGSYLVTGTGTPNQTITLTDPVSNVVQQCKEDWNKEMIIPLVVKADGSWNCWLTAASPSDWKQSNTVVVNKDANSIIASSGTLTVNPLSNALTLSGTAQYLVGYESEIDVTTNDSRALPYLYPNYQFIAYKAAKTCSIFEQYFTGLERNRMHCVLGMDKWVTYEVGNDMSMIYDCPIAVKKNLLPKPCKDYFQERAVSGYYDGNIGSNIDTWISQGEAGYLNAIEAMRNEITSLNTDSTFDLWKKSADQDGALGINTITYEAGYGPFPPLYYSPEKFTFIQNLGRRAEMREIVKLAFQKFKEAGGEMYGYFGDIGTNTIYGSWGVLEYTGQINNENTTSRYEGIKDFVAVNDCWWDKCGSTDWRNEPNPSSFANLTGIYKTANPSILSSGASPRTEFVNSINTFSIGKKILGDINLGGALTGIVNANDFGGSFKPLWTDNGLYLSLNVTDDNLYVGGEIADEKDGFELMLDTANGKNTTLGTLNSNGCVLRFVANSPLVGVNNANCKSSGVLQSYTVRNGGYIVDIFVPWTSVGSTIPVSNSDIGIDIKLIDNDGTVTHDRELGYNASVSTGSQNPSLWGTLKLLDSNTTQSSKSSSSAISASSAQTSSLDSSSSAVSNSVSSVTSSQNSSTISSALSSTANQSLASSSVVNSLSSTSAGVTTTAISSSSLSSLVSSSTSSSLASSSAVSSSSQNSVQSSSSAIASIVSSVVNSSVVSSVQISSSSSSLNQSSVQSSSSSSSSSVNANSSYNSNFSSNSSNSSNSNSSIASNSTNSSLNSSVANSTANSSSSSKITSLTGNEQIKIQLKNGQNTLRAGEVISIQGSVNTDELNGKKCVLVIENQSGQKTILNKVLTNKECSFDISTRVAQNKILGGSIEAMAADEEVGLSTYLATGKYSASIEIENTAYKSNKIEFEIINGYKIERLIRSGGFSSFSILLVVVCLSILALYYVKSV